LSDREKWNRRYAAEQSTVQQPDEVLIRAAAGMPPGRALDIACGTGRNALYLARSGWSVFAVDISDVAVQHLNAIASTESLRLDVQQCDLTSSFPLPAGSFDLICNARYLQRDLFPSLQAALRPGGLLVALLAMEDDDPAVKPMNSEYLLRPGELKTLAAGLDILFYEEAKADTKTRKLARMIAQRPPGGV
jgi:tellurite methyltransferase